MPATAHFVATVPPLTRRRFLHHLALGSATCWLTGFGWSQRVLAQTVPVADRTGEAGVLILDLAQFPVLQQDGGSLQLAIGLTYPVMINRADATTFYAVNASCKHVPYPLSAYDSGSQRII